MELSIEEVGDIMGISESTVKINVYRAKQHLKDNMEDKCHESLCNPVMQAKLLNKEKTDLNVIVGLCVGHDSIFMKYSEAPVTTLITKDKVLVHNPVAALYASSHYYKRLLEEGDI